MLKTCGEREGGERAYILGNLIEWDQLDRQGYLSCPSI